jgi:trehalose/maltose hydrolase-like predicted phosphorylase
MTPAHLTRDWLDQASGADEDPWILRTGDPDAWHHRDAAIGNGLFGMRVNGDGDGSDYRPGSCSFMNGFWGEAAHSPKRAEAIAELPHWATLRVGADDRQRRDGSNVLEHRQEVDLRTATVRTMKRVEGTAGPMRIERETWIARADKHIGVLSAVVTAGAERCSVYVGEVLDAMAMPDLQQPVSAQYEEDLCLTCTSGRLGHRLAIASRVLIQGIEPQRVFEQRHACHGPVARRWWRIALAPGQSVTITKVVALVADRHAADPMVEARRQVAIAAADLAGVRARHEVAWAELWQSRIEVDHPRLQQLLNAFLFHLYSTVRSDEPFSHGPCGLSNDGWDGTIFWDTDLWTLPIFALFHPDLAMACARYRVDTLPGALENARERGEVGARYAWQSAATGRECCTRPVFQDERHIVSCVARGQWLATLAAGDRAYLFGPGLMVIRACAEYWAGRVTLGEDGQYHILRVCGPDEDAGIVDDNAMTNWSAAWTLRLAHRLCIEAGQAADPRWLTVADNLHIPWDAERGIPKQMTAWRHGQTIKQADATLLAYPWDFPMDDETRARLVDYYRQFYPENQIMMGVAIDGIVDCQLGRAEHAWRCLSAMLPHVRRPYLLATESPAYDTMNFLTGIGGFLQLVCMGFAGVAVTGSERLEVHPCLPAPLSRLALIGIHLRGRRHSVEVARDTDGTRVTITPPEGTQ